MTGKIVNWPNLFPDKVDDLPGIDCKYCMADIANGDPHQDWCPRLKEEE